MSLQEAQRQFKLPREKKLKQELIANLRDDGKGHHHSLFADRLEDFDIQIVPLDSKMVKTAAISWDQALIYINEGFLDTTNRADQLNVLLRHELAHNLMMHQIRMMHHLSKKYGEDDWQHKSQSQVLHDLINIIEDAEISNKRYTAADKQTVRYMTWNYKLIGGIVTEDIRKAWADLSVEEMYDKLSAEIEDFNNQLTAGWYMRSVVGKSENGREVDLPRAHIAQAYIYRDLNSASIFNAPLDKIIASSNFKQLLKNGQDIVKALYQDIIVKPNHGYTRADLETWLKAIANSSITANYDITNPEDGQIIVRLYTPEEKYFAVETLKNIIDFYLAADEWTDRIQEVFDTEKYSAEDIQKILDALKKQKE